MSPGVTLSSVHYLFMSRERRDGDNGRVPGGSSGTEGEEGGDFLDISWIEIISVPAMSIWVGGRGGIDGRTS